MQSLPRRIVLLSAAAVLAGCATKQTVVLDRQAAAGIRRVGLPTIGAPAAPMVRVVNSAANHFGLVGAIAGATVRVNRSNALARMMAEQGFDGRIVLAAALTKQLAAHNLSAVPFQADPARRDFLPAIPASPGYDAVLDVYVSAHGFLAASDSDSHPYRATVAAPVRLVATPGNAVLMSDVVLINMSDPPAGAGPRPSPTTFLSFSDVEKNPAAGVAALAAAYDELAAGIVRRIT